MKNLLAEHILEVSLLEFSVFLMGARSVFGFSDEEKSVGSGQPEPDFLTAKPAIRKGTGTDQVSSCMFHVSFSMGVVSRRQMVWKK